MIKALGHRFVILFLGSELGMYFKTIICKVILC